MIFNKKDNLFYISLIFFLFIYLKYIINGTIIYDDWATYELSLEYASYYEILKSWFFGSHYTRPIASLYLPSIGFLFKQKIYLYILNNLTIFFITIYIFTFICKEYFGKNFALFFFILCLTPTFSSTNIFSPIEQSQGILSNFFASLSFLYMFFFLKKKKKIYLIVSYILIFAALLCYETAIVFVPLLVFFKNRFDLKINNKFYHKNIKKISIIVLIIAAFAFGIFFYQTIMMLVLKYYKLLGENKIYKYGFKDRDFYENLIKFSYTPFTLLIYNIPQVYLKTFLFVSKNTYAFFQSIFIIITIFILSDKNITNSKSKIKILDIVIVFTLSYSLLIFIHIAGASLPTITGYHNRAFVSFSVIFPFCLIYSFFFIYKKFSKFKKYIFFFFILIMHMHIFSFLIQTDNFIELSKEQKNILNSLINKFDNRKVVVFANMPTYLKNNFNNETIFSEEVNDWPRAIWHYSNKTIQSERIYYDKNCENILNFKDDKFSSLKPSRSRKIEGKVYELSFTKYPRVFTIKDYNEFYIYKYSNNNNYKIKKFNKDNLQTVLGDMFGCKK